MLLSRRSQIQLELKCMIRRDISIERSGRVLGIVRVVAQCR